MTRKLITSLLCGLVGLNPVVTAQTRPKLVVGIVVDQLRTDYIDFLQQRFGEQGFNKLIKQGAYLKDVDFSVTDLDEAMGTALVMTGAYPSQNGVTGATIYDPASMRNTAALADGNGYSPKGVLLSTVSDEIAVDGGGLGYIYSIATDPQTAVIMGGHSPNAAVWIDDNTGRWTTSSYYKGGLPMPLSTRNHNASPALTIDSKVWKPQEAVENYLWLPKQKRVSPFMHTFRRNDRDVYRRYLATPLANEEVTDVAIDFVSQLRLGQRGDVIDMLNIGYTLEPYPYVADGDSRFELQDSYLRLDSQLARLLGAIDSSVGLDNAVIFLTSTGYFADSSADDERYAIPGGTLSLKRAASLLNSYLSAKYGSADYVASINGHDLYLHRKTIENRRLDFGAVTADAREFIARMSGIANAYTLPEILSQQTPELRALRLRTNAATAGDIYLEFDPGWIVVEDLDGGNRSWNVRASAVATPAFILAPEVAPQTVAAPVDAIRLAPTVCGIMRIRSPNGAAAKPLVLEAK